jgi:hypothetical protein
MKRILLSAMIVLLALSILGGCNKTQAEPPVDTEPSTSSTESAAMPSVENTLTETEDAQSSDSDYGVYEKQIERYYTAISNQWNEGTYFDNEMCPLVASYYEGNASDNVGFAFMDLDGDNVQELIIGAIDGSEQSPLVFEIWTQKNGEPIMLAQSGSRNRYYLQYAEDDAIWSVAYEAENGAANYAVYYLQLSEGKFEVIQGVLFDAIANENAPWFMAYDLDWDVSNDTPIDEDLFNDVMESERNIYAATEYTPYSQYK